MAPPRKTCPYETPDALRGAILAAGGYKPLARNLGVAAQTVERWMREHGVETPPQTKRLASALSDVRDDDLVEVCGALGMTTAARLLQVSRATLRDELARRGLDAPAPVSQTTNPRAAAALARVRQLEKENAAVADLAAAIREAAQPAPAPPKPRVLRVAKGPIYETPVDVVLHVSDIQYGEVVHSAEVPGGHYSPEVFEKDRLPRWQAAVDGILEGVSYLHPIRCVWICEGGDFVEGQGVFQGQEWHLAMDAGQQVVSLSGLWAGAVARVADTAKRLGAEKVARVGVVGNHGVHGGRKAGAVPPSMSYDWLTYEMVSERLKAMGDPISFTCRVPSRALYFDAQGHVVLLTHGDQDRGGGLVGVPVVTGLRNDLRVRMQTGLSHRYHLKGHYHVPTQTSSGGDSATYWNGDWCGSNNLSVGRGGGSEPTQHAYVVHPEYGISGVYPIRLAPGSSRTPPEVLAA